MGAGSDISWKLPRTPLLASLLVFFLIAAGSLSIITTYTKLSHVADEPAHIATGMEWWKYHTYTYESLHPPLARLMTASLLYAFGKDHVLNDKNEYFWFQGLNVLYADQEYGKNLRLARLGVLPFFIISCLLVYAWARSLFGTAPALLSLLSYVTLPAVAAHAGLATTDMGHAAMVMAALMAGIYWLKAPTWRRSVLLGVIAALAVCTKFSAAPHLLAAAAIIIAANQLARSDLRVFHLSWQHMRQGLLVVPIAVFVLGCFYFFNYGAFFEGLQQVAQKNRGGHATWLFHKLHHRGVWYFFPVVYVFKTPITFLISNALSALRLLREEKTVERLFPLLAAMAILLISMPSNINIGVRHVLVIYPLLAVPAGYGLLALWNAGGEAAKPFMRVALLFLMCWQLEEYVGSAPDRLRYYNEPAFWITDGAPERISFDSDFSWGQGYFELAEALHRHKAWEVYTCFWYDGFLRSKEQVLGMPTKGCPEGKVSGWLVLEHAEKLLNPEKYQWLENYTPIEDVGRSTWIYRIP